MHKTTCGFLFLALVFSCLLVNGQSKQGQIIIDREIKDAIPLEGEWEFYWNRLLTPSDSGAWKKGTFITVPGSWHLQNDKFSLLGFGTYRLNIRMNAQQTNLSLFIPVINSSARVWINGKLEAEIGNPGSAASYSAKLSSLLIRVPMAEKIELIIHVANYSYFSSGLVRNVLLGNSNYLLKQVNVKHGIENFFVGSLFAMFVYQIILFFLYQRGKPYLFLSLICLCIALRAMTTHGGSFLLPDLIPEGSWETWKKTEFLSVFATVGLFALYIHYLFPDYSSIKPVKMLILASAFLCMAVILTPQYFHGKLLDLFHIMLLSGIFFGVVVIRKAIKNKSKDARLLLVGIIISLPFILLEIVKNSPALDTWIPGDYFVEIGLLIFLGFQTYILARSYANSIRNLEKLNEHLESTVLERTAELTLTNHIKDKLMSVMAHDIKTPLNSMRGIVTLYNGGNLSPDEIRRLTASVEQNLNNTCSLLDNILLWTSSQLQGIKIKRESVNIHALVNEHILLYHSVAHQKKIIVKNSIQAGQVVIADKNVMSLVIRNLIVNAIKFCFEGGHVSITQQQVEKDLIICVEDNGIGMNSDMVKKLFRGSEKSSPGTAGEMGSGLGLMLCRDYLKKMDSLIWVESAPGRGSRFFVRIAQSVESRILSQVTE